MSLSPVGSTPVQLSGVYADAYILQNQGPSAIYVGHDSSLSQTAYDYRMAVGQTLSRSDARELWLVCAKGESSVVSVISGDGTTFSPAPDQVTVVGDVGITGVVDVAGNVAIDGPVSVTGTVDVAGDINVTNSTLNVAGTVGARQQNNPSILFTSNNPWSGVVGVTNLAAIPNQSIAGYSAIIINVFDNGSVALAANNMVTLTITQYAAGSTPVSQFTAQWLVGRCNSYLIVPVVGITAVISGQYIIQGGGSGTLTVQVIGSNQAVDSPQYSSYNSPSGSTGGNLATGGYFTMDIAAVTQRFVSSKNGPAQLSVLAGTSSSAGSANIAVVEWVGPATNIIMGTGAIAAGGAVNIPLVLPMRPVYITGRPTAGDLIVSLLQ